MRGRRFIRECSLRTALLLCGACAGDGKHAHGTRDDSGSEEGDGDSQELIGDSGAGGLDASPGVDAGLSPCTVCTTCEQAVPLPDTAYHVEGDLTYPDPPPAGGDHHACWLNFGVYDQEMPDERWVHNLEHGGVVLLYNCPQGCAGEVAALEQLMQGKAQVLLTPYAALPTKFAAVSWGYRLLTDCLNSDQFLSFYTEHVDRAPESIKTGPPSAYCSP